MTAQLRKPDVWAGIVFLVLGVWAFAESSTFDDMSRTYPMALSAGLVLFSASIILRSVFDRTPPKADAESATIILSGPCFQILLWGGWALLLGLGAGYILPSIVVVSIAVLRAGFPGRLRSIASSVAVALAIFGIFYFIFDVPLPVLEVIGDILD